MADNAAHPGPERADAEPAGSKAAADPRPGPDDAGHVAAVPADEAPASEARADAGTAGAESGGGRGAAGEPADAVPGDDCAAGEVPADASVAGVESGGGRRGGGEPAGAVVAEAVPAGDCAAGEVSADASAAGAECGGGWAAEGEPGVDQVSADVVEGAPADVPPADDGPVGTGTAGTESGRGAGRAGEPAGAGSAAASGRAEAAAEPAGAVTRAADGWVAVVALPVSALRLAGRFFVPLALWFSAGSIVRYLLLQGVSRLGHGDHIGVRKAVVLLPLSVAVLVSLVVSIGMLFTLGRGLAVIDDPEEPYVAAIGRTLFPFVLVYLGWNLYLGDLKELLRFDAQRLADAGDPMDAGTVLQLPVLMCLAVAAVAWALRVLCERRSGERPGHVIAALTAFFEVNFTLYGLYSITQLVIAARNWLTGRVFWHAISGTVSLPSAGPVLSALGLPLVWLAIAAIVFGLEMRAQDAVEGTVLARLAARLDGRPRRLAEVAGRSLREKYVPPAHAVRLVFRAGAPVFAWFCLWYAAFGALLDRAQRGVVALIGTDHTVRFWNLALTPIEFGHRMLYEIVRLALLAAMFELVTRRAGVFNAGRSAPARPTPATGPDASSA